MEEFLVCAAALFQAALHQHEGINKLEVSSPKAPSLEKASDILLNCYMRF